MTLKELQKWYPDATEHTWHQHPNGGGWVQNTATVDDTAYVETHAIVADCAQVREYGYIEDLARVTGNAIVTDRAVVSDHAKVTENAVVRENTIVTESATVTGFACIEQCAGVCRNGLVKGNAIVTGSAMVDYTVMITSGTWPVSPLYIQGSRYPVYLVSPVLLNICCETHTIDDWLGDVGENLARREKFSDAEIAEYRAYVELARDWSNRVFG